MQPRDGSNRTRSALDLDLPVFHHWLRHLCLGRMDPAEFWHAGQLFAVGHHRPSGTRSDDLSSLDYFLAGFLAADFLAAGFLIADLAAVLALTAAFLAVVATALTAALASSASTLPS